MADLTARIEQLSEKKRMALELLRRRAAESARVERIPRRASNGESPLSFAQQRMWFLQQLEPESPYYNLPGALHLKGALDLSALRRALDEIVRRHETLRTGFVEKDGGAPVQIIEPALELSLPVLDLRGLSETRAAECARRLSEQEARRPFDLRQAPMLRACLLRLSPESHTLLLTFHHIISDGWSIEIFIRELSYLYNSYSAGETPTLPALPIQYADYASWQRERLTGESLAGQLEFWKKRLSGAARLELPGDRIRPAVQSYRGASIRFSISEELTAGLEELSRAESATLFITMLAAFQSLLYRYTGQKDISVGTAVAGRNRTELEGLIGAFVNLLVLRNDLSGDPGFRQLLSRVRETALAAYAHQDVPFEKLVEELHPERDAGHSPLFQAMFILKDVPSGQARMSGLELSTDATESRTAKHDLIFTIIKDGNHLTGMVEYSTDLFDESRIERMVKHYEHLLTAAVQNPDERVSRLQMLGEAERRQLLHEFNQTAVDYPSSASIHELFSRQARQTPDAPALLFEGRTLSYRELDARSNQLAHYLQDCGVGAESLVGVLLPRSLQMVISLLAVLKAGGAYVPLDPTYPLERLSLMMEDAQITVLLTEDDGRRRPDESAGRRMIYVAQQWAEISRYSTGEVKAKVEPENTAYVIYTSGSTGTPKGVMVSHRSVVNLINAIHPQLQIGTGEVWTVFHSYSFDFSVWEIWCPLLTAGKLVIVPSWMTRSPAAFRELLINERVTVLNQTPSAMAQLIQELKSFPATDERLAVSNVILGGEATPLDLAVEVASKHRRAWNFYGPTESTVWATTGLLKKDVQSVSIGKPIANIQTYILDEEMQAVPVGVPGEIHIAGIGLARGYLHRPALTAEKFIPHPFSTRGGERMYRTGDIGRYRADGTIEYIGRVDEQVKVRGYRIELGEIEHVLRQHGQVRDCVVVAQGDGQEKRLVAYLVTEAGEELQVEAVRNYLREKLPEYMIPSVMTVLEEIPLSPNGKVNRKALPSVEARNISSTQNFQAARTPTEEILLSIWQDVLKVSPIGIHDNFFELGGHSLLATQVFSRLREVFGVELPLRTLFESPRVSDLALHLDAARQSAAGGSLSLSLQPITARVKGESEGESEGEPLPLSFAQQRLWFLDQLEPGSPFYNVPTAVRLSGRLDHRALERTLSEVVRRHEVLRTTFATIAGAPYQVVHAAATVVLPLVDLSELEEGDREATVRRLAVEEARRGFDLSRGPLLRVMLLRVSEREHVALLTMHHIVSDGWSMGLLIREVSLIYDRYSRGEEAGLAELAIQYGDYARWQREWLTDEVLEEQVAYWKRQLAGMRPMLKLPFEKRASVKHSFRGAGEFYELPGGLSESLNALMREEGATLFMLLLAAFYVQLSRYTGETDIVVGTDIAGREHAPLENLIGFFVNQLVLRADLSDNPTFREFLRRVRGITLNAYAHQSLPFDKLVEVLNPDRTLGSTPLFRIKMVLQNAYPKFEQPDGLTLTPDLVGRETGTAKFDLMLNLTDTEEGLKALLEYNTDLFDAADVRKMLRHFETLLNNIAAQPDARLNSYEILTEDEKEKQRAEKRAREESKFNKFRSVKPRVVSAQPQ